MTLHRWIRTLLLLAIGLPLVQAVLHWTGGLLAAMGDKAAATAVGHVNTALAVAWLVVLVGLVVSLGIKAIDEPPSSPER